MFQFFVVVFVFNECDNILLLFVEIVVVLCGKVDYEVIYVDDDFIDDSCDVFKVQKVGYLELWVIYYVNCSGQSIVVWNGVCVVQLFWIVMLDGDGQNDLVDIFKLLVVCDVVVGNVCLLVGWCIMWCDSFNKCIFLKIVNVVCLCMFKDVMLDIGCGLKLFECEVFLCLFYFDYMYCYLFVLVKCVGFQSQSVLVGYCLCMVGIFKYGMFDCFWVGLVDLCGVVWLMCWGKVMVVEEL